MPRTCTICRHDRRVDIDKALVARTPFRHIAARHAVVQTSAEAHAISGDGRAREVWTMEEIGRVLVAFSQQVGEAKQVFPGCEVVAVRPPPFDEVTGDDLPM